MHADGQLFVVFFYEDFETFSEQKRVMYGMCVL